MKRIILLFLTVMLIVTMVACSNTSKNPNSEVLREIEKELGTLEKLPIDIYEAVEQVGSGAAQYQSTSTDEETNQSLAVFEDSVLYSASRTEIDNTDDGLPFSYIVTVLHIGQIKLNTENTLEVTFVAAHLQMNIISDDVDTAKAYLKNLMDDAPIDVDRATVNSYNKLIDGEQIYLTSDSVLWDEFIDVDEETKISCDPDNGTFEIKFVGELGVLYHDETRDENDALLKDVAYYYDEAGNRWIESILEYSYLDTGEALLKETYYYANSAQISKLRESISATTVSDAGIVIDSRTLMEQEFYEDGTLKLEYHDYSEAGDEEHFRRVYYYANGQVQHEESIDENGVHLTAEYSEDGSIRVYEKFLNEQLLEVVHEDGTKITREYYDDMNLHFERWYNSKGILYRVTEFQPDGTRKDYEYDEAGNIINN